MRFDRKMEARWRERQHAKERRRREDMELFARQMADMNACHLTFNVTPPGGLFDQEPSGGRWVRVPRSCPPPTTG